MKAAGMQGMFADDQSRKQYAIQIIHSNMIRISILLPAFKISSHASHNDIIERVKTLTGCQQIHIHEIKVEDSRNSKREDLLAYPNKQYCVQVPEFCFNLQIVAEMADTVRKLQKENEILHRDLAGMYEAFQQLEKAREAQLDCKDEGKILIGSSENIGEKKQGMSQKEETLTGKDIADLEREIKQLVKNKLSQEQTIAKYDSYCQQLIKFIQQNKIPIL